MLKLTSKYTCLVSARLWIMPSSLSRNLGIRSAIESYIYVFHKGFNGKSINTIFTGIVKEAPVLRTGMHLATT